MRAARLHGVRDLRVEELPDPVAGRGELLVRVEACGVCPTDVRKYLLGTTDGYPLNPGHEWVGPYRGASARASDGWELGAARVRRHVRGLRGARRAAGRAGRVVVRAAASPDDLALERAIFVEPFADCLHAVRRPGAASAGGQRVVVVGGGQMGLQLVVAAALEGC